MKDMFSELGFEEDLGFEESLPDVGQTESFVRGVGQGVSFGFADEITGGLEALLTEKTYEQARDESRRAYADAQKANPITYGVGEVGGAVGTAFIPGLGALNAAKGARAATVIGKGALQGAIAGAGLSESDSLKGLATDAAIGAGVGGAAGAAGKYILEPAVEKAGQMIARSPKKTAQIAGRIIGVDEDAVGKYWDNPSFYKDPKSLEQIKDRIDDVVGKGKSYVDEYQRLVDRAKNDYGDVIKENLEFIAEKRKATPPMSIVDSIGAAVEDLKDKVSKASGEAFKVLDETKVKVPRQRLEQLYKEAIDMVRLDGQSEPITDVVNKEYQSLLREAARLKVLPEEIKLPYVKRLIQDLDASIDYSGKYGSFNSVGNSARQHIRGGIDEVLKGVSPEYRVAMEELKPQVNLLRELNKRFGDDRQIFDRVNNLHNERNRADQDLLNQLFTLARRDLDVSDQIDEFTLPKRLSQSESRDLAKGSVAGPLSPLDEARRENVLESFKRMKKREIDLLGYKDPTTDTFVPGLKGSVDDFDISPERTESVIKDFLARGRDDMNIESRKKLEALTEFKNKIRPTEDGGWTDDSYNFIADRQNRVRKENVSGPIFEDLEKLRVNDAFNKDHTRGSRNVNLGGIAGGALGFITGGPIGGVTGAAISAGAGYVADKFGGKMLKGGIDAAKYLADSRVASALGPFASVLQKAATRGDKALATTHFILQQRDPDYRRRIQELEKDQ